MSRKSKWIFIIVQVMVWVATFMSPILYLRLYDTLSWSSFLRCIAMPMCLLTAFYLNYCWFVPHLFFRKNHRLFVVSNLLLILFLALVIHVWVKWDGSPLSLTHLLPPPIDQQSHSTGSLLLQSLHTMFNLTVSVCMAIAVQLAGRWVKGKERYNAALMAQREAELKMLRYQFHPHFILNTLNNIYALTEFDMKKAQTAILELSKMLYHILYDNDRAQLMLSDEVRFLQHCVNLMRLRVPSSVEIVERYGQPTPPDLYIAPMLLISLVENAFKHGISPTQKSFIHISVTGSREAIVCEVTNSNHPKPSTDKSGSGIGLQQFQRRLDLLYPQHYKWERGISADKTIYTSKITLYDTQLYHH